MDEPDSAFQAKSGGAILIASGTVIPLDSGPLDLEIPTFDKDGKIVQKLTLRLIFSEDETDKSSRFTAKQSAENPAVIELESFNLNAPLGAGTPEPFKLWRNQIAGVLAVLRFHTIAAPKPLPPTIHFSFYQKPNAPAVVAEISEAKK